MERCVVGGHVISILQRHKLPPLAALVTTHSHVILPTCTPTYLPTYLPTRQTDRQLPTHPYCKTHFK